MGSESRNARQTARLLEARGITVDLLPAKVPPGYRAEAFVSVHADGNADPEVSGFKVAASGRDTSGRAEALRASLEGRYSSRTRMSRNPSVTADMTGYYAFDSRRFRHAVDPATPSVILETGFLTNAADERLVVQAPRIPARGIAEGVEQFLRPSPSRRGRSDVNAAARHRGAARTLAMPTTDRQADSDRPGARAER